MEKIKLRVKDPAAPVGRLADFRAIDGGSQRWLWRCTGQQTLREVEDTEVALLPSSESFQLARRQARSTVRVWGTALAMRVARPAHPPVEAHGKKCGSCAGQLSAVVEERKKQQKKNTFLSSVWRAFL